MPSLTIQEGYQQSGEYTIEKEKTTIGRNADNDIVLADKSISRHHAEITHDGDGYLIRDLDSHNGTFQNARPVTSPVRLNQQDVLQLGEVVLVYNEFEEDVTARTDLTQGRDFDFDFLHQAMHELSRNVGKVIRGKEEVIQKAVIAFLCDGHLLLEDMPGVGKTMLARALARSIRADFKRIQFTPDMLPTDVTGVNMYDEAEERFKFVPGPIFSHIVLADEINRGTPRTQSSLLECMSESAVTVDGDRHVLPKPFFVVATQNPIEFEGTYALPEAQLDRFLVRLRLGYPDSKSEREILAEQTTSHPIEQLSAVLLTNHVLRCQELIRTVHVSEPIRDYIVTIVEATRAHDAFSFGCSPRASIALMRTSQAHAAMEGRNYVVPHDVRDMAVNTLSHRAGLKLQAQAEWDNGERVIEAILDRLPIEKWEQ